MCEMRCVRQYVRRRNERETSLKSKDNFEASLWFVLRGIKSEGQEIVSQLHARQRNDMRCWPNGTLEPEKEQREKYKQPQEKHKIITETFEDFEIAGSDA